MTELISLPRLRQTFPYLALGLLTILLVKDRLVINNLVKNASPVMEVSPVQRVQMQHCKCSRILPKKSKSSSEIIYNSTTCSRDVFERGAHQRVVGFSFYGDIGTEYEKKKGYFEGIKGNLKLMPKYYPGWTMRVYFDLNKGDAILNDLCDLACENPILDICHAGELPGTPMIDARKVFAMNWRFFPTLDPQVCLYSAD